MTLSRSLFMPSHSSKHEARQTQWLASLSRHAGMLALPVLLWLVGALFFGGTIGLNSDDYALNLRDPATGEIPKGVSTLVPYGYFFRPLHLALTFTTGTYFPDAARGMHIASAIAHALVCIGVYWLARTATRSSVGAICAALLFLTLPINAEVILWFSTISTAISVLAFFWLTHLVIRFAERADDRLTVRGPVFIAAVAFIVVCLFEQPLAGAAGLPLLCLGVRSGPSSFRVRVGRAVQVGFACASAGLAYSTLLLWTAPAGTRGGAGSFVPAHRLGERFSEVFHQITNVAFGPHARDMILGSTSNGWGAIASPAGVVIAAAALAATASLVVLLSTHSDRVVPAQSDASPRVSPRWMLACSLVSAIAAWIPVYVVDRQIVQDRTFYFPLVMVAIALALGMDALLSVQRTSRFRAVSIAAFVLLAAILAGIGTVSQIGSQRAFQERSALDSNILSQFAALLPNPPKNAIFVPMWLDDRATHTGRARFDSSLVGVMHTHWSASDSLRRIYKRSDLGASGSTRWTVPPFVTATPESTSFTPTHTQMWTRIPIRPAYPWSSIVPYSIDAAGTVRIARAIIIEQPDGSDLRVDFPERTSARAPRYVARTWDDSLPPSSTPIAQWIWSSDKSPVSFEHIAIWSGRRLCAWMHPVGNYAARRAMQTTIPASDVSRRVVLRATISDFELAQLSPRSSVFVVLFAGSVEVARVEISPSAVKRTRGWFPLVAELPPSTTPVHLTLSVEGGSPPPGTPPEPANNLPPIRVTSGVVMPSPRLGDVGADVR
jgi:hypothetical protein